MAKDQEDRDRPEEQQPAVVPANVAMSLITPHWLPYMPDVWSDEPDRTQREVEPAARRRAS